MLYYIKNDCTKHAQVVKYAKDEGIKRFSIRGNGFYFYVIYYIESFILDIVMDSVKKKKKNDTFQSKDNYQLYHKNEKLIFIPNQKDENQKSN